MVAGGGLGWDVLDSEIVCLAAQYVVSAAAIRTIQRSVIRADRQVTNDSRADLHGHEVRWHVVIVQSLPPLPIFSKANC